MNQVSLQDISIATAAVLEDQISFAYLFGSYVSGQTRNDSDVDIAIMPSKPLSHLQVWELAQQLASKLKKDVDLINLMTCSTVLRFQITTEGKLLSDKDQQAAKFEVDSYRMYQDLQFTRHGNIKDFLKRISIE